MTVIIAFGAALIYIWLNNKSKFKPVYTNLAKLFSVQWLPEKIRFSYLSIRIDKILLTKSLACLGLAMTLFIKQTITKLSPGVVAVIVAMILFAITNVDVGQMESEKSEGV